MKFSWRREALPLGLIVLMFGLAAWQWPTAPELIPIHWNLQGQVNGWGGKFMGLLLLPLTALGMELLLLLLPRLDPKRENYERFQTAYDVIRVAVLAFLLAIYIFTLPAMRGRGPDIVLVVLLSSGLLIAVLGAVMGKLRPNWFAGVRTPWTLSSQLAWGKTNRLGGWIFLVTGLATMGAAVMGPFAAIGVLLTGTLGGSIFCIIYSYLVWKQDPDRTEL